MRLTLTCKLHLDYQLTQHRSNQCDFRHFFIHLSAQLQYRLDLSAVVGLFAHNAGYQICQLNPCLAFYTETSEWTDLDSISHYVATVYAIEAGKDADFKQLTNTDHSWEVEMQQRKFVAHPFYTSGPFGRMTRVLVAADAQGTTASREHLHIIKLSFVDKPSRFRERDLYTKAHGNGFIRGLALCIAHRVASQRRHGAKGYDIKRSKCSLALGSVGRPLSQCRSVLELLKVMYDAVVSTSFALISRTRSLIVSLSTRDDGGKGRVARRHQPKQYFVLSTACTYGRRDEASRVR